MSFVKRDIISRSIKMINGPLIQRLTGVSFLIICIFYSFILQAEDQFINRTVLALYDSSEPGNIMSDYNMIHKNLEMPLNHLGIVVRYHDISAGLPLDQNMEDIIGIVTWFNDGAVTNAVDYCQWAKKQIRNGKKYVIIGSFGAFTDKKTRKRVSVSIVNEVFNEIGLFYEGNWTDNPFVIEISNMESSMVEFERTLEGETNIYDQIISSDNRNKIYLTLNRTDIPEGNSAAVVVTSNGGFVLESYELFINYENNMRKWRINPFKYMEDALGLKNMPRYDVTTLFGRRLFYSHIDGDGLRSISQIDGKSLCGEIIYDHILAEYDLPVTVGFITSDIDPSYLGSEKLLAFAKKTLSLENVEIGVHGFSHPLDWDRMITAYSLRGYSENAGSMDDLDILSESAYGGASLVTVNREKFISTEIKVAADFINNNAAPPGKKAKVYQWTGNCAPTEDAIALTKEIGLMNINGGDTRFDNSIPSYTRVAPLTRQVGGEVQMFTSNCNENIYTNLWEGPFYGFRNVIQTFKQTEVPTLVDGVPRRVDPINVYYHFYSGEKEASLKALKEVYDYSLTQDIIPVFTSYYLSIVTGFLSGRFQKLADGGWKFSDYGTCQTVRFDETDLFPDLERSSGVIGFIHWNNRLYVHLSEKNNAILYFAEKKPQKPYLVEASAIVSNWTVNFEDIKYSAYGFGKGIFRLAGLKPKTVVDIDIVKEDKKEPFYKKKYKTDKAGELYFVLPVHGKYQVIIKKAVKD